MSAATNILETSPGPPGTAYCEAIEAKLLPLDVEDLALPSGPSAVRLLGCLVSSLLNPVTSRDQCAALSSFATLARCPANRDVILDVATLSGPTLEALWGRGNSGGVDSARAALLTLLYRVSGYRLDPADILELDRSEPGTSSSGSATGDVGGGGGAGGGRTVSEHRGVAAAAFVLSQLLWAKKLEPVLYAGAARTLSMLALPDTYFNPASRPRPSVHGAEAQGPAAPLAWAFEGDDVSISQLNGGLASGVNALIAELIGPSRALDAVAEVAHTMMADLRAPTTSPSCPRVQLLQSLDELMGSALGLVHNLLLFATQRTALLRQHLAAESSFIAKAALPYVRLRLDAHAAAVNGGGAGDDGGGCGGVSTASGGGYATRAASGRAVLLGLRCLAVATFKLKVHRQRVCEDGLVRRLLLPGRLRELYGHDDDDDNDDDCGGDGEGGGGARRATRLKALAGEALAAAVKLHINVEGGFGPGWELQHREATAALFAAADGLGEGSASGNASASMQAGGGGGGHAALAHFARSLAGGDALPVHRASRAFAALAPLFDHAAACCPAAALEGACGPAAKKKPGKGRSGRGGGNRGGGGKAQAEARAEVRADAKAQTAPGGTAAATGDARRPAGEPPLSGNVTGTGTASTVVQSRILAYLTPAPAKEEAVGKAVGAKGALPARGPCLQEEEEEQQEARSEAKGGPENGAPASAEAKGAGAWGGEVREEKEDEEGEDEDEDEEEASGGVGAKCGELSGLGALGGLGGLGGVVPALPAALGWVGSDAYLATRPWRPRTLPPLTGASPEKTPGLRS